MRMFWLVCGLVSALTGAVFVLTALWMFGAGHYRSVFAVGLWLWLGLHALFAVVSLFFFRLARSKAGCAGPGGAGEELASHGRG